ncbi:hypothetical protein L1049_018596 [Liquidambar formosana]|uniref:Uncharacterized protein n=1 Tax=Liquidambar formosana TaxID=63359 RepID=A0AAP0RAB0_LIQFO
MHPKKTTSFAIKDYLGNELSPLSQTHAIFSLLVFVPSPLSSLFSQPVLSNPSSALLPKFSLHLDRSSVIADDEEMLKPVMEMLSTDSKGFLQHARTPEPDHRPPTVSQPTNLRHTILSLTFSVFSFHSLYSLVFTSWGLACSLDFEFSEL